MVMFMTIVQDQESSCSGENVCIIAVIGSPLMASRLHKITCRSSVTVTMLDWKLLDTSVVLVDPSLSMFDIVHISKDIAGDAERVRDWCLAGEIIIKAI